MLLPHIFRVPGSILSSVSFMELRVLDMFAWVAFRTSGFLLPPTSLLDGLAMLNQTSGCIVLYDGLEIHLGCIPIPHRFHIQHIPDQDKVYTVPNEGMTESTDIILCMTYMLGEAG